jgi:hypothetical protein
LWSLSASSSDSESSEVSSQSIQPVVDESGHVPMQSLADPTPLLGGDVPCRPCCLTQPIQPVVEKVVTDAIFG